MPDHAPPRARAPTRGGHLGQGHHLDGTTRSMAETAFGGRLDHVTVHTGTEAQSFVGHYGATAATVGSQIAFANGSYRPGTLRGDALIAHELAHVVQQDSPTTADTAVQAPPQHGPKQAEHEADRAAVGALLASGRHASEIASLGGPMPSEPPPDPTKPKRGLGRKLQLSFCSAEPDYASSTTGEAPTTVPSTHVGVREERIGPAGFVDKQLLSAGFRTIIDGDGDQSAELDLVFTGKNFNRTMEPDQVEVTATRLGNTPDRGGPGTEKHQAVFDNTGRSAERNLAPRLIHRTDGRSPTTFGLTSRGFDPFATFDIHPPALEGPKADYRMVYGRREDINRPASTQEHTMSFSRNPSDIYPVFVPMTPQRAGTVWVVDAFLGRFGDTFRFTFRKPDPAASGVRMGVSAMAGGTALGGDLIDLQVIGNLDVRIIKSSGISLDLDLNGDGKADIRVWETMVPQSAWGSSILDPASERSIWLTVTSPDGKSEYGHVQRDVKAGQYSSTSTLMAREFEAVSAAATPEGLAEAAETPDLATDMANVERQIKALRDANLDPPALKAYDALVAAWLEAAKGTGPAGDVAKNQAAAAAASAFGRVWETTTAPETVVTTDPVTGRKTTGNIYTGHLDDPVHRAYSRPTHERLAAAFAMNNRREASRLIGEMSRRIAIFVAQKLRRAGKKEQAEQMERLVEMHRHLNELADKKDLKKATAVFHSAPDYVQQGVAPNLVLRLYYWREGDYWHLRDLTHPSRRESLGELTYKAGAEQEPPHELFNKLDDKERFPKGFIQYQLAGANGRPGTVQTHADWEWYEVAHWISMALAAAAIVAGLVLSGGTAAPVLVPLLWTLSAAAGVVGSVGHMVHEHGQGRLDAATILVDGVQIVSSVAGGAMSGAKAIHAFRLIGAEAKTAAAAAKLAPIGVGGLRLLLTIQIATDTCQVIVAGAELLKQLQQIEASSMSEGDKLRAKILAIGQFGLVAGLSYVSVRANASEIRKGLASGGKLVQFGRETLVPGMHDEAAYTKHLEGLASAEAKAGMADQKVRVVPPEEIGSTLGLARIDIVNGKPQIVVVDGAPLSAIRQEIDHLEQLALVGKPSHELSPAQRRIQQAAQSYVSSAKDWAKMSDAQRLKAHKARLLLEEDGQLKLIQRLKADFDAGRPVNAHDAENAFLDLQNIRQASADLAGVEKQMASGAKLADIDAQLAEKPGLFMKKTLPTQPLDDSWRHLDEEQFLLAYNTRYPNTSLSDEELKLRHAMDQRLNPQTGRLVDVNKEFPDVTAKYTGKPETMPTRGTGKALSTQESKDIDALLAKRDAARLKREKAATKVPPDDTARHAAQYEMNEASRLIGERSAAIWTRRKYPGPPEPIPMWGGEGSRPGDFDQIWQCTEIVAGKKQTVWIVVEAKGGASGLGSRRVQATGQRAQQGTQAYFDDILRNMFDMGGDARKAVVALRKGRAAGEPVRYMHIEAPMSYVNESGVVKSRLDDVQVREFDLTPPTTSSTSSTATP